MPVGFARGTCRGAGRLYRGHEFFRRSDVFSCRFAMPACCVAVLLHRFTIRSDGGVDGFGFGGERLGFRVELFGRLAERFGFGAE
jgi:hypothetical protein